MKIIKSLLLSAFAMLVCSLNAANNVTQLVVWAKDGTNVAYALYEQPKITFIHSNLIISTHNMEVSYPLSNLLRFTYVKGSTSGITDITDYGKSFRLDGETLLFPQLKKGDKVSVYSPNGIIILEKSISIDGEYAISLSQFISGVYVVNVNGLTYKIIKR